MKRLLYWLPAIVYGLLIFLLSHQSNPPGKSAPDYVLHFVEYGIFAVTLIIGITQLFKTRLGSGEVVFVLAVALIYAASDEFHQTFIPNRDGSFRDWISDTLGAVVITFVIWFFQDRVRGKLRR